MLISKRSAAIVVMTVVAGAATWVSCSPRRAPVPIHGARISADGSSISIWVSDGDEGGNCWKAGRAKASLGSQEVIVDVRAQRSRIPDCSKLPKRVTLAQPVGDRVLVDGGTGKPLSVLPLSMPEPTWIPPDWTLVSEGGDREGWAMSFGGGSEAVAVRLLRTGTSTELVGATVVRPLRMGDRHAAIVHLRNGPNASGDALVMMDEQWTLVVSSPSQETTDLVTIERIARSLTRLPFVETLGAPVFEPIPSGTVASLLNHTGPAIVTAYFSLDASGTLQLCDALDVDGRCLKPLMDAVWKRDNTGGPPGLTLRKDQRVTAAPLTVPVDIFAGRAVAVPG
jgi:hypothetical protein